MLDAPVAGPQAPATPSSAQPSALSAETPAFGPDQAAAADALFETCLNDAKKNTARLDRDRQDWQNILMWRGGAVNQWAIWDRGTNSYIERPTEGAGGLPDWIHRAASNVFAQCIDGVNALLNQSAPAFQWAPATDDDEDRASAEVAETASPVLLDEIHWDELRARIHALVTLIDKVAIVVYYDNDAKYGMAPIAAMRCTNPECDAEAVAEIDATDGACAACGADVTEAYDPMGMPVTTDYPIGRICAELIPSFEFTLPSSARVADARLVPWVLTHSRMAIEDAMRLWGDVQGAKDAIVGSSKQPGQGGVHRVYGDALPKLSSPRAANAKAGLAGSANAGGDGPIVYRLYHDPTDELPDGLLMVKIGDVTVEQGPLPFKDDDGRPFKNLILRTYAPAPGSAYGKPPADDLVPLQQLRNTVETLITCILMRTASPTTWLPLSVTLEDQPTGIPGEHVRYRSIIPGEKPTTEAGHNPPEGLYKFLEMIDAKFQEISKLNSVLLGARPSGDPTLGEVEILQERGMASFKSPLDALISFDKQVLRQTLSIARQSAWSPRFRKVRGENGQWETKQFVGADLTGKVDITCEPSSAWPKSPIMQSMRLDKALERGVLPPPATDPELQAKILGLYNLADLKPSMDVDRKQIARILDRWKAAQTPLEIEPPNPMVDNLPMHLYLKTLFLKGEDVEQPPDPEDPGDMGGIKFSNPPVYQAMLGHVMQIQQAMAMQQMQAAAAQAGPPPPGKPDDRSPAEKGDGSALNDAIDSGVLQPQGAQGDPLQDALNAGVLQPVGAGGPMGQPQAGASIDDVQAMRMSRPLPPSQPSA